MGIEIKHKSVSLVKANVVLLEHKATQISLTSSCSSLMSVVRVRAGVTCEGENDPTPEWLKRNLISGLTPRRDGILSPVPPSLKSVVLRESAGPDTLKTGG